MSVIAWILFGFVVGGIGKLLLPESNPGGFFLPILFGIAGAFLGLSRRNKPLTTRYRRLVEREIDFWSAQE